MTTDELRDAISELEDDVQAAEYDDDAGRESAYDLEAARCRLSELREELRKRSPPTPRTPPTTVGKASRLGEESREGIDE